MTGSTPWPTPPPDVELLGPAVLLRRPIVAEVRRLLAAALRDAVHRDGVRPSQRLLHLLAVLDAAANVPPDVRTVTSPLPPSTVDAMTTSETAAALGIGTRQTRRLAGPLGARRTATGWAYPRQSVDTAAERRKSS